MITYALAETESELEKALAIRHEVFVNEQGIDEEIEHEGDNECVHLIAYYDNTPAGAMRLHPEENIARLQRLAVLKEFRNLGIGTELMKYAMQTAKDYGFTEVYGHAQTHAINVYLKLGFKAEGDYFIEQGIEHITMRKKLI